MLVFIGILALFVASIDGVLALFGWSLTAVSWSPAIFMLVGLLFIALEGLTPHPHA